MTKEAVGLQLKSLAKSYGPVEAVKGVDLAVYEGEFLTLLGPSGSGKTTILRLIAGFTLPTSGQIMIQGRDVSRMTPAERGIGMVFQHYALFPHMTVAENIAYPLKMRGWPSAKRETRVREMQELVGLHGMDRRLPRELSGGQQQRVALARALAFEPTLLLMDEPLGALDRELRIRMAAELRRIHRELGTTVMYVTHDREEAMTLADRVAIMHLGLIDAVGSPHDLFSVPPTRFVASFFGGHNLLPAELTTQSANGHVRVHCLGQDVEATSGSDLTGVGSVWVVVPAQAVKLGRGAAPALSIKATVAETLYVGGSVQVTCEIAGTGRLLANLPVEDGLGLEVGASVELLVKPADLVAVAREADSGATAAQPAASAAIEEVDDLAKDN
jgi:ABC-type Fe3+/spermidine/putrescine transport system ATPase subunit